MAQAAPQPGVASWLRTVDEDQTFLSVVTITELRYGIQHMARGARKKRIDDWLQQELLARFEGRILPVDLAIADECGRLLARCQAKGRPVEARDAFIAATSEVYDLTLVTRNVSHFQATVKSLFTPWTPNDRVFPYRPLILRLLGEPPRFGLLLSLAKFNRFNFRRRFPLRTTHAGPSFSMLHSHGVSAKAEIKKKTKSRQQQTESQKTSATANAPTPIQAGRG